MQESKLFFEGICPNFSEPAGQVDVELLPLNSRVESDLTGKPGNIPKIKRESKEMLWQVEITKLA